MSITGHSERITVNEPLTAHPSVIDLISYQNDRKTLQAIAGQAGRA
jgi:hypothetical protein